MEQLMEILKELRPDVDFETEKALIDNAILDSFDIVSLIGELNDAFGVEIEFEDMEPENFNSAEDMYKLIQRLQQEA
ncbi:acyl carrier protein [Marvinbryantia sp.]|uniref:acyl carrier protein n=1 Tax=Marvinbryantia sp. TaxID=2496532 RepID=UPI0025E3F85B|nr:acyl carrier protein [uncultured Marvinbryantia sp.]